MSEKPEYTILTGCKVLDLTGIVGQHAISLLGNMGAEIIRVDPENAPQPFYDLVKTADIFIEASPPGLSASLGFNYKNLDKVNPRLIMASITPFGQTGLDKNLKASDFTLQALGGWLSVTGAPENPLKLPVNQAYKTASLFAVNAVIIAWRNRQETGRGQYIDVSIMECVAATLDHIFVRYFYEDIVSGRQGSRTWNNSFDILPCKDGNILISIHRQWEILVELLASEGMAEDLADAKWLDRETRNRGIDHIVEVMRRWTIKHPAQELEDLGQLMHFPWAAVKHA
jgi:crotonobetainyl-CoA:carnitine CoA-transferase CaiB-like acyl-CoA transferase